MTRTTTILAAMSTVAACLCGGCTGGSVSPPAGTAATAARPAVAGPRVVRTKTGAEMLLLPGGTFSMGDDQGEDEEKPAHEVRLSPFYIDVCEVTQESYQALMGRNPAKFTGPRRPVDRISWQAAILYCNIRSRREGLQPCYDPQTQRCDFTSTGYRLPTEAEWEYACRAGSTTRWPFASTSNDLPKHGWFKENAAQTTHPVREKLPNAWGLYDMLGNVAEWCNDYYAEHYQRQPAQDPHGPETGDERVLRGGSWNARADACCPAARKGETPGLADVCFGYEAYGFRCVRRADPLEPASSGKIKQEGEH